MHSIRTEKTDNGLINITAEAVISMDELEKFTTTITRLAAASNDQDEEPNDD
ncbi:hypothetical protein [Citricoccus sp. NR2]|uniref:hypothetical protein n=1 Tax=Citricoccus sp. NR2 TaxID=3004095 RepID=UPI0022DE7DDF|nr:hypothetical protein [Citricoccus sp. NR2]WBL19204.1 hypothetical protein O1A05_00405 [Citricoccus sp. NR2]